MQQPIQNIKCQLLNDGYHWAAETIDRKHFAVDISREAAIQRVIDSVLDSTMADVGDGLFLGVLDQHSFKHYRASF